MAEWRQEWDEEAAKALLAVHRLRQGSLEVKLDKGFEPGVYGVTVEYSESVQKFGFTAARRQARDYATRLHGQLSRIAGKTLDKLDDASLNAGQGQKRDLEGTFLTFAVSTDDGSWHDDAMNPYFPDGFGRRGDFVIAGPQAVGGVGGGFEAEPSNGAMRTGGR